MRSILFVALLCSAASADAAVLNAVDRGWYKETGSHGPANQNTLTGLSGTDGALEYRSYFLFDLSSLAGPVRTATLQLEIASYWTPDSYESITLWDVSPTILPSIDTRHLSGSESGLSIYEDLGSGAAYGTSGWATSGTGNVYYGYGSQFLSIELNAAALADIRSASGGLFAIGISLDNLAPSSTAYYHEFLSFSSSDESRAHTLTTSSVPIPAAAWLFGSALIGLRWIRRKRSI